MNACLCAIFSTLSDTSSLLVISLSSWPMFSSVLSSAFRYVFVICYVTVNSRFKSSHDDKSYSINYNLNCNSSYVVYLITCKKCSLQYVGSTTTKFRLRFITISLGLGDTEC